MHTRAIIFDLDGTATPDRPDSIPSRAVIEAVQAAREAGLYLSAATGRTWKYAQPVISALGLSDPCVIAGGSMVINPLTQAILWESLIDAVVAIHILAYLQDLPYEVVVSRGLEQGSPAAPAEIIGALDDDINVMYVIGVLQEDVATITQAVTLIGGVSVNKAHSWHVPGAIDLHLTPLGATKRQAVSALLGLLEVPATEAIGIGDGYNDSELFAAVGHRVAMGNAVPELKALADEVIGDIGADGLATYLMSKI